MKEVLVPDWDAGCRRLAPGVGYLSDLASHKSSVAYGEIVRIGPQGPTKPCTPSGSAYLCHRFDKSFKSLLKLVGNDEHPLSMYHVPHQARTPTGGGLGLSGHNVSIRK